MCVCVCVCVFITLTDRASTLSPIIHLENKNAVADPVRVCWTGGKKGNKINPEIPNPVEKRQSKAETKQKKASETVIDTNDRER